MTYPYEPHEREAAGINDTEPNHTLAIIIGACIGVIVAFALVLKWSLA